MALGNGGLDAQVEQRMDAYRGNPQQLQQRYGVNKDLMDLLALQQIKKDKEAVVADMQLKMQQQPGTIAQQREQEVLALTKQEMGGTLGKLAENTKGTLDQRLAEQKKNMGKMAQNASKPKLGAGAGLAGLMGGGAKPSVGPPMPPQGGPQAAGLPNARMMQAARGGPVRRMAQGGIVSFAGDDGNNEVVGGSAFGNSAANLSGYGEALSGRGENAGDAIRQYYAGYGITNQDQWARTPADAKKRIISAVKAQIAGSGVAATLAIPIAELNDLVVDPFKAISNLGIAASNTGLGSALGLSDPRSPNELWQYNTERKRTQDTLEANTGGVNSARDKLPEGPSVDVTGQFADPANPSLYPSQFPELYRRKDQDGNTGIAALPTDNPQAPALENSSMTAPEAALTSDGTPQVGGGIDMSKLMGNMGFDTENADSAMQRGFETADAYTGRAEKNAKYDDMLAEMSAFDAENYDPEREKTDRLKAFLIGAGGKTNIGATFGGAGAASMNMGNAQRKDRRTRLMDKFDMEKSKMGVDAAMAESGMALGKELYNQAMSNQRAALGAAVSMRGQSLQTAQADADRIMRKIEGDNTQSYRAATLAADQAKLNAKIVNDENATVTARMNAANDTLVRTLHAREQMQLEANAAAGVDTKKAIYESAELMGMDETEVATALEAYEKAAAAALVISEDMLKRFGRGVDADGKPTGSSLLDAEQMAIEALARLGVSNRLSEDDITSVTTRD